MKRCEHDPIFSGRTNVSGHFEYICRSCGHPGWSESYQLSQVDADAYYQARVQWGWPVRRLPPPPRLPSIPVRETRWLGPLVFNGAVFLGALLFGAWCAHDTEHRNLIVSSLAAAFALCGSVVSFAGWRKTR